MEIMNNHVNLVLTDTPELFMVTIIAATYCTDPIFAAKSCPSPGVNTTAQWGDLADFRPGHTHGRSFDDSQTANIELAHYYAVDQCDAPYVAVFQTDMLPGLESLVEVVCL